MSIKDASSTRTTSRPFSSLVTGRSSLIIIWLLALPALWWSMGAAPALRVDVGVWGDHTALSGINGVEQSSSENYRWTMERATLALPNLSGGYRLLRMRAHGWRPEGPSPRVALEVAGRPWGALQTSPPLRIYSVLLPEDAHSYEVRVGFASEAYRPPGDPRTIGFALDWLELRRAGGAAPTLWQLGGQALLLALALALAGRRGRGAALRWSQPALAALLAAGLVAMNLANPLWVSQALGAWLLIVAGMLAADLLLARRFARALAPWMTAREAGAAWALLLLALALRLGGSAHPLFDSHDVPVHTRWLQIVSGGQLYLYSTPAEAGNRLIFNPPAGYLLLAPLLLPLGDLRLAVQVGTALIDWLGCLLLLPIARQLRLSGRAALIALALAVALPIGVTMLWWGFATNAIAQMLWLLLLWALLRLARDPSPAAIAHAAACATLCLMTHAGALVLVGAMLGLLALLGWGALPPRGRAAMLGALALALLLTLPVYFAAAAAPVLAQPPDPGARTIAERLARGWEDRAVRLDLVWRAFALGFLPPLIALAPAGLAGLLAAPRRHALGRPLVAAWLLVSAAFFLVYMSLGYLTRYIYFAAPLICLAAGALMARLWRRPGGRALTLAIVLLVTLGGAALWLGGVLLREKPSLVPLTH